jgi:RNA polymerase sigma factor (TIGR02999 family)
VATDLRTRVTAMVAGLSDEREEGTAAVPEELLPLIYDELHRLAAFYMSRERPGHTLQPTALVHEAYLKLVDQSRVNWRGRTHFLAVGAQAMRRLLIDHARARGSEKRGGSWRRVTLAQAITPHAGSDLDPEQLLTLHTAIDKLAELDTRQARIVELRYFGGMTVPEVATVLGVSRRTVEDHWVHARAWLRRELKGGEAG